MSEACKITLASGETYDLAMSRADVMKEIAAMSSRGVFHALTCPTAQGMTSIFVHAICSVEEVA